MHFWGVSNPAHKSSPSPQPTNNVGRVYPTLYKVGGGELQENLEDAALF